MSKTQNKTNPIKLRLKNKDNRKYYKMLIEIHFLLLFVKGFH